MLAVRLYDVVLWVHITAVVIAFGALFAYLATDADLWSEVWVTVPFVLLFVIAGLGGTVLRRGEEALVTTSEAGDEAAYSAALATLRMWTWVTIALIVRARSRIA